MSLDETLVPTRRSFVASANGHADFPIQNLPLGVFSSQGSTPRIGVAIGDAIFDVAAASRAGLFPSVDAAVLQAPNLNELFAQGAEVRHQVRRRASELLSEGGPERDVVSSAIVPAANCRLHVPAAIGDYTDFYAGIHHALNVGRQFRPDQPLLPNYKYVPIGYHGRASSVVASGEPVRRPSGQRKAATDPEPSVGSSARLDFELELGVWIGPGNSLGRPVAIADAPSQIAGYCLLNDWSARDLQAWEYQPLGPFLSKSFATSISPWVVTPEALAPFRRPQPRRPEGDPAPLPYLNDLADQAAGAINLEIEVSLTTEQSRMAGHAAHVISRSNTLHMYWTVAQLVTHHTSNGCNLRPGDLLGSGTISTPTAGGFGSLLEITEGGRTPLVLPWGESRTFLIDGDEIVMRARASGHGAASIGFGEVRARILPAL